MTETTTLANPPLAENDQEQTVATLFFSQTQLMTALYGDDLELVPPAEIAFHIYKANNGMLVPVTFTGDEDGLSDELGLAPCDDSVQVGTKGVFIQSVLCDDTNGRVTDYETAVAYIQRLEL